MGKNVPLSRFSFGKKKRKKRNTFLFVKKHASLRQETHKTTNKAFVSVISMGNEVKCANHICANYQTLRERKRDVETEGQKKKV